MCLWNLINLNWLVFFLLLSPALPCEAVFCLQCDLSVDTSDSGSGIMYYDYHRGIRVFFSPFDINKLRPASPHEQLFALAPCSGCLLALISYFCHNLRFETFLLLFVISFCHTFFCKSCWQLHLREFNKLLKWANDQQVKRRSQVTRLLFRVLPLLFPSLEIDH